MNKNSFMNLIKMGKVIIFGAGQRGLRLAQLFKKLEIPIEYFCDNNVKKHHKVITDDIKCISYDELQTHKDDIIILSMFQLENIPNKMMDDGFKIILTYDDVVSVFKSEMVQTYPSLQSNIKFKDKHKGQRCFILGNGPSIKNQDLSLLKDEITFTVNLISRNEQFKDICTNYHFIADALFFQTENAELINDITAISRHSRYVDLFIPYTESSKKFCEQTFKKINNIGLNYFTVYNHDEICTDLTRPINAFNTVVQFAVAAAIYMGFSEIYLLGCDCTDVMNLIEAYSEKYISGKYYAYSSSTAIHEHIKKSLNYGFDALFKCYSLWFSDYKKISKYCQDHNIIFKNCTDGGILDCVERASYEDIIKNKDNISSEN